MAARVMKQCQQVCQNELPIQSKIHHKLEHHASQVDGGPEDYKFVTIFSLLKVGFQSLKQQNT